MMFEREDDEDAADKIFAAAGDVIVAGRMTLAAPVAVVGGIFVSRSTSLLSRKWKSLSLRWIIRPHSLLPSCRLRRCLVSPIILNVRR